MAFLCRDIWLNICISSPIVTQLFPMSIVIAMNWISRPNTHLKRLKERKYSVYRNSLFNLYVVILLFVE